MYESREASSAFSRLRRWRMTLWLIGFILFTYINMSEDLIINSSNILYAGNLLMISLSIIKKYWIKRAVVASWFDFWSNNDYIPVNLKRLSDYLGISKRTLVKILKEFCDNWFLSIYKRNEVGDICYKVNKDFIW